MTNGNSELPELPAPRCTYADHSYPAFTKQQMLDYARSALSVCAEVQADGGKGEAVAEVIARASLADGEAPFGAAPDRIRAYIAQREPK